MARVGRIGRIGCFRRVDCAGRTDGGRIIVVRVGRYRVRRDDCGCQTEQVIQAFRPNLRFHHHAGTAAGRRIVNGMMHVMRPVAQVVRGDGDETLLLRLAEQAQVQHVKILRKHGHDIDLHVLQRSESRSPTA